MSSKYQVHPMEQAFRDWDAKDKQFQRELNIHICRRWDELIAKGKHGHYESLLSVCRSAISFWRNRAETESQASADTIRDGIQATMELDAARALAKQQQEQIKVLRGALKDCLSYMESAASVGRIPRDDCDIVKARAALAATEAA